MNHPESTVLLVQDDPAARDALSRGFQSEGYAVVHAASEAATRAALNRRRFCLAVVDEGIPGSSGLPLGVSIRRQHDIPVLVLSSRGDEAEAVRALDAGADGYLQRPVGTRELVARAKAVLRRARSASTTMPATIEIGQVALDPARREVRLHGRLLRLTPTEFRLFSLLAHHAGEVLPHGRLLQLVWGAMHGAELHMLHVNICRLRRKLARFGDADVSIETIAGVGYVFESGPPPARAAALAAW